MYSAILTGIILAGLLAGLASAMTGDPAEGLHSVDTLASSNQVIACKNIDSGVGIANTRIYVDGGYAGATSGKDGLIIVTSLSPGEHSVRAVSRGYMENTTMITIPSDIIPVLALHPLKVIPTGDHGPVEERIDVVFVPSKTEYDCTKKMKVETDYYTSNEENFRRDVDNLIQKRFFTLNTLVAKGNNLPENISSRFNFYYYSDPGDFADAFKGCAGTLPEDFWEEAPFTDVAVIIYPKYTGIYSGPPCEPNGCSSTLGPGIQSWFKAPANSIPVFTHESGHAAFALIDTYCGETYYTQNELQPNVWNSQSACVQAAKNNGWDPNQCRQITQTSTACQKGFWRYDPEPDIMGTSLFSGKFGSAATSHMQYILENINRWKL
ncbi:hypothetical protein [uncultured Methanoregula sp.]|uniref:hypothetical protein n=1 Tax=uncultured Methanoregula sp. TaxID=1005933 RepID=UPI002AAC44A7|nr:hypothetical protein [uncultured Methanoregula sp.]